MGTGEKGVEPAKTILLPYLQRADELQKHDPLVAYYCRLYAMERGLKYPAKERSKTMTAILISLMNQLEKDKKTIKLSPDDNLHVEGFALNVFSKADKQDRAGRADLNTAKTFYAASIFFEILNQFGELDPEIEQKQKYAVWKAADIRKALSEGRTPQPGPPGGDDSGFSLDNVVSQEDHEHEPVRAVSSDAPHKYDDAPHKYDDAPHKYDDAPHKYDDAPHKYDDAPHKYEDSSFQNPYYTPTAPPPDNTPSTTPDTFPHTTKHFDSSLDNPYYTPTAPPPDNTPSATPDTKFPHTTEHFVQPDHNESNQGSSYPSSATPFYPASSFTDSYASSLNPSLSPYSPSLSPYNPTPSSYTPTPTSSSYVQSPSSYPQAMAPYSQGYQAQPAGHTTVHENPILRTTSVPVEQEVNYKPPPERVADAHKSARFAVSALAFDDVPTAISYLKRSLELLTSPHAS